MSRNLGMLTNTGKDNGYSGENVIGIKDPHYGWEIGRFYVSGYTRETKDDSGNPVFLKNVGDQVTLWFNLGQDIDNFYYNKEHLPENLNFVKINHKETLAQIFTDIRYTRKDNEALSKGLIDALIRQGFLPYTIKKGLL